GVSEVARMAGLRVSQLFRWRNELCKHAEASMAPFVPVEIGSSVRLREVAESSLATTAGRRGKSQGFIEIDLGTGQRVRSMATLIINSITIVTAATFATGYVLQFAMDQPNKLISMRRVRSGVAQ